MTEQRLSDTDDQKKPSTWKPPLFMLAAVGATVIVSGWALVSVGWVADAASYVELIGRGALTAIGALALAWLLHYRWVIDRETQESQERRRLDEQEKLERDRLDQQNALERNRSREEQRRHRDQERGKRQEKMGERLAQAVTHLGTGQGYMQVAGLVELGGLVDDWWSIGQEILRDIPEDGQAERAAASTMIKLRRQEIIDLMFKHTLRPDTSAPHSNPDTDSHAPQADRDEQRRTMVQEARSQILAAHLPAPNDTHEIPADSWAYLNLSHAYLRNAQLSKAFLTSADLSYADLQNATLHEAELRNSNLTHAKMQGAKLIKATLRHADLTQAKLQGSDLTDANLWDATLTNANLQSATLTKANLRNAECFFTDLRGATLDEADLQKAKLLAAKLQGAELTLSDLQKSLLANANLSEAILNDADLRKAVLSNAKLNGATLSDADLRATGLGGADFSGANLSGQIFSGFAEDDPGPPAQLDPYYKGSPYFDEDTNFPDGYDPDAAGFVQRAPCDESSTIDGDL